MSGDVVTSFLTYYVRSLGERTRVERVATRFGFDWIIYNLALAEDLKPYRLPFFRSGPDEISKTKTEAEFGVDCSFLSPDGQTLSIFVLKDEELRNATWVANGFDADLRKAAAPDLTPPEFKDVRAVRIVLAYNKDEDQTGVQLFTNLTQALGTKVGEDVALLFERWNLTAIVEAVKLRLLTPSLLPQKFFSLFNYLCSQVADFRHGSDEWTGQLVPNWRRFLHDVLEDNADERCVRLLPVALLILREQGRTNPSIETGWIDLTEWAMLAAWRVARSTKSARVKQAVMEMWLGLYLAELERFYQAHAPELVVEHSLAVRLSGSYLEAVAAAMIAFWHIGRLGVFGLACSELLPVATENEPRETIDVLNRIANWLVGLLNGNPSAKRPLLDIHHIELFLVWRILWQVGRMGDLYHWLLELEQRLLMRRTAIAPVPFLEGGNSLDRVFECVATGEKPPDFNDQSSLLLLCLLEFCFSLEPQQRNELMALYYREIVLGVGTDGEQLRNCQPIDLMGWAPPADWSERILSQSLANDGESITLAAFDEAAAGDGGAISAQIEDFVRKSRTGRKFDFPDDVPASVLVLACLKHGSPLPPEFWRHPIFGAIGEAQPPSP